MSQKFEKDFNDKIFIVLMKLQNDGSCVGVNCNDDNTGKFHFGEQFDQLDT